MNHNVIFEVLPYPRSSSDSYANKFTERMVNALSEMKSVSLLNIPEILEENHMGRPYYRNCDNRKFGSILREKCSREIMFNTVVVHHASHEAFEQWLDESINFYGAKNFVFVGSKINS